MSPIVWMCGIGPPPIWGAAYIFREATFLSGLLIVVGMCPILVGCGVFIYFAVKDPDRLHSEDYRLRTQMLDLAESKGGVVEFQPIALAAIANPYPERKALAAKAGTPETGEGAGDNG